MSRGWADMLEGEMSLWSLYRGMKTSYLKPEEYGLIREVGEKWMKEHHGNQFSFEISIDVVIDDLIKSGTGVIALWNEDKIVGFLALFIAQSFMGSQKLAVEKYWYVEKQYRIGGIQLLKQGYIWAKENGCSHIIMTASNLASGMYDKVCNLYQRMGMELFETSYIQEIK